MKKIILPFATATFLFVIATLFTGNAQAAICQPVYGGQTCIPSVNIMLNKMVQNPQTNQFVENLGLNDPKFAPDQTANFQVTVTNTGEQNLGQIILKDTLPQFIDFVSGAGSFDANTKVLTFEVDNLGPNDSRTFVITGRVVKTENLPANQGVTCVINQINAVVTTSNNLTVSDNAQLCIEKPAPIQSGPTPTPIETKGGLKVFPAPVVKKTPPTGPELLTLIGLIPTGLAGIFLRKKAT